MFKVQYAFLALLTLVACKDQKTSSTKVTQSVTVNTDSNTTKTSFSVTPISHATMVLVWDDTVIYVDPVGGAQVFEGQPKADLILVTDIHGDHLNVETLAAVTNADSKIIMPQACVDKLPESFKAPISVLNNGETQDHFGISTLAIPMYNLREEDKSKHIPGRGNGYVLEKDGKRVYISGDTEDIPEMRNLKDIDVAFVCMNLPYTMTVESAADAVLAFKPNTVYPYHYRGADGLSDVSKFKELVTSGDSNINVIQLDWYAK